MSRDDSFREFVLDQLAELRGVRSRRMFGGHGLYLGPRFFGILFRGRLYFRVDERSRPDYVSSAMAPFRPNSRQKMESYYEVPADVVEDAQELGRWAQRAAACGAGKAASGGRSAKSRARSPRRRRG